MKHARTLSVCSMLEISLRICCDTLDTRRGFAMHVTWSGAAVVEGKPRTACEWRFFPLRASATGGHTDDGNRRGAAALSTRLVTPAHARISPRAATAAAAVRGRAAAEAEVDRVLQDIACSCREKSGSSSNTSFHSSLKKTRVCDK